MSNTDDELDKILENMLFETGGNFNVDDYVPYAAKQIKDLITKARIDELEKFKVNRSHNKGELVLIEKRLNQLKGDK